MPSKKPIIQEILESSRESIGNVYEKSTEYELQIIYTRIDRDSLNQPHLTTSEFYALPGEYFYPASSIKLYAAVLALEKLNELAIAGLDELSQLNIDSAYAGQTRVTADSSSENGKASIAHFIKKLFLVSDNDAFNRLYEFLGQEYLNKKLWEKGLTETRIFHRLSVDLTAEQNRYTNAFSFWQDDRLLYKQSGAYNPLSLINEVSGLQRGIGYLENGELIRNSKDFSQKNYSPLIELHQTIQRIVFPELFQKSEQFNLTKNNYNFLLKYMSMFPGESQYPNYPDSSFYYDSYVKFFMFGDSKKPVPRKFRIFNKVGDAYGYLIDNAYIVDFEHKVEFFLSAVIYVNENQIFNDDHYEYEKIGLPFLANLGRIFYNYERTRIRKYKPDLTRFNFNYKKPY